MLYSIQKFAQGIVDGISMPDGLPALTAWVTPPVMEQIDGPRSYVWGGRVRGSRQTAPRRAGFKKIPWVVDVWLAFLDTPDDALANESFPKVIDAVLWAFFTAPMNIFIDGEGNVVGPEATGPHDTQVQAVGESFDLEYPPERLPMTGRMVWYSAHIAMDILEVVQA